MNRCFLCGEGVDAEKADKEDILTLCSEAGDVINVIHQSCYDHDDREYLDRSKIINVREASNDIKSVGSSLRKVKRDEH